MKKGIAVSIISVLTVIAILFSTLYITNNASKTREIDDLTSSVADRDSQIKTLNADVADKAGQIETLTMDVENKASQIETLNADVADKASQIETLNANVAEKSGQIESLTADVTDKAGQIESLTADVADKAGQIETLTADVADKKDQIVTLKADVADRDTQIKGLKTDIEKKDKQIVTLSDDVKGKKEEIETLNADIADKTSQIDTLTAELADKSSQVESLTSEVSTNAKEIEGLKKQVEEKDTTIQSLQEKASVSNQNENNYSEMDEAGILAVADKVKPVLESYGYTVVIKNYNRNASTEALADVDAAFIEDLASGITERLSQQTQDMKSMTDAQVIEYNCDLIQYELNYIEKYENADFTDKDLGELANSIITSQRAQIEIMREYYGKDTAKYQREAEKAADIYLQALYKISKKYGLNVSDSIKKDIINQGALSDGCIEASTSIENQLKEIHLDISESNEYSLVLKPLVLKNESSYNISYLSIRINLYDQDDNYVNNTSFCSAYNITAGSDIHTDKTYFFDYFDHITFEYELQITGQGGSKKYTGSIKPNEPFSWNGKADNKTNSSYEDKQDNNDNNNAAIAEQKENANAEIDSKGILFLDIPWGKSKEDYFADLVAKGFFEDSYQFSHQYVCLYPQDDSIFDMFSEKAGTTRVSESQNLGAMSTDTPLKTVGGLECTNCDVCFSYDLIPDENLNIEGMHVKSPEGTQMAISGSHVYSTILTFKSGQKGDELLNTLIEKYGDPTTQNNNGYSAAIWTKENTKLVYFMDKEKAACTLWYINTEKSDALKEKIESIPPKEVGDAGI